METGEEPPSPSRGSFSGRRIGFAGPMLGSNPGWVISQHEILAERMANEGAEVFTTSSKVGRLARLIDTLRSVRRWRGRIDAVVIAVFSGPGFWMADVTSRVAKKFRIPQILVLHGGNLPAFATRHTSATQRLLKRADAVVAPSQYLASELPAQGAIEVIPNVFDIGTIPFQERGELRPRLLWMRTFHPIYNPLLALDVFDRVRRRHPEATLTMAGQEKGLLAACVERAGELGLADAVTFPGFLDEQQKRQALADHDVFLNTNDVDNTPVSVLEAAAAGLPIVATDVGGLLYLLRDGQEALLVPRNDPDAMADAVEALLGDAALAQRLSVGGRSVAERSDWRTVRYRWLSLLDQL